jgi:uncharacterized membrane protein YdbT with pleckstrin-like domain
MSHYLKSVLGQMEEIILITRHHWFVLLRSIFVEGLMITAILVLVSVGIVSLPQADYPWLPWLYLLIILPFASLFWDVLKYTSHAFVVTNRRIIQIDGIINKNVTDSSLEKVNDVKMKQSFFGRIFDFGDIEIMTASELGINKFTTIARPIQFKTAMLDAKEKMDVPTQMVQSSPDLPTLLAQLDNLRKQGVISDEEFQAKKAQLLAKM